MLQGPKMSPEACHRIFALTLPAATQGDTDLGALYDAPVVVYRPCNVLLVEDDEVVRITAIAMLQSLGHRVQACADADEALELLDREASVHVLFTDLMMPGSMGGLELAVVARQRCPLLKIILTSGWADSDLPANLAAASGDTFELKLYSLADLSGVFATISGMSGGVSRQKLTTTCGWRPVVRSHKIEQAVHAGRVATGGI